MTDATAGQHAAGSADATAAAVGGTAVAPEVDDTVAQGVLRALGRPPADQVMRMAGYDAIVWRAVTDGSSVAVRLLPPGRSPDRELTALRRAASAGPVIPRVLATGRWHDRAVIVQSWCGGRPIGDLLVAYDNGHPPADGTGTADRLGRLFGAEQARLHDHGIAHLDYQPFNVLTDGAGVTGVVDWNNSRAADLRLDLAHTQVVLDFAPALLPEVDHAGFAAGWTTGYRSRRPWPEPDAWRPFLAEAAATQAGEWQRRAAAGVASSAVAAAAQAVADRYVA